MSLASFPTRTPPRHRPARTPCPAETAFRNQGCCLSHRRFINRHRPAKRHLHSPAPPKHRSIKHLSNCPCRFRAFRLRHPNRYPLRQTLRLFKVPAFSPTISPHRHPSATPCWVAPRLEAPSIRTRAFPLRHRSTFPTHARRTLTSLALPPAPVD